MPIFAKEVTQELERRLLKSRRLYEEAKAFTTEGVQHTRRYMSPCPVYMQKGEGGMIYDVDGNAYIDWEMASGPLLLGHRHPYVMQRVIEQLSRSQAFYFSNEYEVALAKKIHDDIPSAEVVRLVMTGTDANILAVRLARAYTGRDLIGQIEGAYHGCMDYFLAGLRFGKKVYTGAVKESADKTLVIPWNDELALSKLFEEQGERIAAVIVEPIMRSVIPPLPGYLEKMRSLCTQYGAVLIFDEVVLAFRFGHGGAQSHLGVYPDITTLGKAIGGGFPIGGVGGKKDIMELLSPTYQGDNSLLAMSTWYSHPVAMVAGLANLEVLEHEGTYDKLCSLGDTMRQVFAEAIHSLGLKMQVGGIGPLFKLLLTDRQVIDWKTAQPEPSVMEAATTLARRLFTLGVIMIGPRTFIPGLGKYISTAHTEEMIHKSVEVFKRAVAETDLINVWH